MLRPLGLRQSAAKTRIVHMADGFDFLGFHIQWKRNEDEQNEGRTSGTSTPSSPNDPSEP